MPFVSVTYGAKTKTVEVPADTILGEAVAVTELPLEQPCAGRGTCGKCRVLIEKGPALDQNPLSVLDDVELDLLSAAEQAAGYRLACRAKVLGDVSIVLAPIVVYSNKIFRGSERFRRTDDPLALAIDLGSTTVAAFLVDLGSDEVCRGAAALNQQTTFGADVISRLAAARSGTQHALRLSNLALASIVQAVDALRLPRKALARIERASIVGNTAMHHLLLRLPVESLAELPFQPHRTDSIRNVLEPVQDAFPNGTQVDLPPVIGGFVGSDALACLAYFGFPDGTSERRTGPMLAIDLGTNGEILATDGERVLVTSTAAGPAFEGVNISCGSRAVDGAIVDVWVDDGGELAWRTIGDAAPVGLTGSGLLTLIAQLQQAGAIQESGRFATGVTEFDHLFDRDDANVRRFLMAGPDQVAEGAKSLYLSQKDVRELQKSRGAVRAAGDVLLKQLGVQPSDLEHVFLTGSFGGQVDIDAVLQIGMIPPVEKDVVDTVANGAGLGAAMFLTDEGFALGERLAEHAEQVELDQDPDFNALYVGSMPLCPDCGKDWQASRPKGRARLRT
jgi:uncharacterized 2Fe-2S/4Fe-4S cluster protein (DUF4445 family)